MPESVKRNLSKNQKRLRMAIKIGLGGLWLLGIGIGITTLILLVTIAFQNPITPFVLLLALGLAIGLPTLFLGFKHVRDWFVNRLEAATEWCIPTKIPLENQATQDIVRDRREGHNMPPVIQNRREESTSSTKKQKISNMCVIS